MKRKLYLTLILPFLICIMSGFSPPQNQEQVDTTITKADSLTVNLKFQNPKLDLVVKDQRNLDAMEKVLEKLDRTDNAVANAITSASQRYLSAEERELGRRYESAMDYLERKSNNSASEIENFIRQKRLSEALASIVLIVSLITAYGFIVRSVMWKNQDWRVFLTRAILASLLAVLLYILLNNNLHSILFPESYRFYSLINLSG